MAAVIDWPAGLEPQTCSIGLAVPGQQFRSPYNGAAQTIDFVGDRLQLGLTIRARRLRDAGPHEAFVLRLANGRTLVRAWHFARPQPAGTLRGAPVLNQAAAWGALQVVLTTTAGATLRAGDVLGCNGELWLVAESCTAVGSVLTVPLVNRVRAVSIAAGAAVQWDAPKAVFIAPGMTPSVQYRPGVLDVQTIDLDQHW